MTQKERFVALLREMGVGFTDEPYSEQNVRHVLDGLRRLRRTEQASKLEQYLAAGGNWSIVVIDEGNGYNGFFCDFLFAPDGTMITYGCGE